MTTFTLDKVRTMHPSDFINISAAELRAYQENHRENEYLLVDVRQPGEYAQGHIAGAELLPLSEMGARLTELPTDKDIIFYCRSGKRSQAAALFWTAGRRSSRSTYNLEGGMLAWDGRTLKDFPRLEVLDLEAGPDHLLKAAMNLEKGAELFYNEVLKRFPDAPFASAIHQLAKAEEGHARLIHSLLTRNQESPPPFEEVYASLPGDVLEGGRSLADMLFMLDETDEDPCTMVVELALTIEYAAYDLYRSLAHLYSSTYLEKPAITIAQAEKEHMRIAADALALCR